MNGPTATSRRLWAGSVRGAVCGAILVGLFDLSPVWAQDKTARRSEPEPESQNYDYSRLYIDSNNSVRIASGRQPISLENAMADLLKEGTNTDEIRHAVKTMRKRIDHIHAEIRGSELGTMRLENQHIAVRRTARVNEQYRRVPRSDDSARVQQTEEGTASPTVASQVSGRYAQVLGVSPEEENRSLGHGTVTMTPNLAVVPHRYSSPTYDPELVKKGLQKVQNQLNGYEVKIAELYSMKKQLASSILSLEAELRYRNQFGMRLPDSPRGNVQGDALLSHQAYGPDHARAQGEARVIGDNYSFPSATIRFSADDN